ncbi:MAG TPA: ABC transporter substrate-binding protein [Anaerolineae bacterium]|nr:ABC transporter substrate-binding protein [Anaerolineae bacterium]
MRKARGWFPSIVLLTALFMALAACSAPPVPEAQPTSAPTQGSQPTTAATQAAQPTTAVTQSVPTVASTNVPPTRAPTNVSTTAPTSAPTSAPTAAPTTATAGVTITDSAGRKLTLANIPARIVSLAPSTTEIVCALNACDKLIGVDTFSDFPAQVKSLPKLSNGFDPNYEQIVAVKPDLILAAGITSPDVIKKMEDLQLPVLVVGEENASFDTIKNDIALVGMALGSEDQAKQVNASIDQKIADVKAKVAQATTKPRVFWELDATDPAKPYTPGPGSFINQIIEVTGGENVASRATSPYPQLSAEEIIQANPQVIILSDAAYGVAPESVGKRPGWDVIDAVKNNRVYPIDDNLVSRPGPRVAEGVEAAAKLIHPELFTATSSGQTFTDPFAYCSAVGNADTPSAPYVGDKVPKAVVDGLRQAMGGVGTPDDVFLQGTFWRCMGGKVYACNVGANIPCDSKADTNKTPMQAMNDYCKQNPNTDFIPAVVTGHSTVYEWKCQNGAAQVGKQLLDVDAQGYPAQFWYEIKS